MKVRVEEEMRRGHGWHRGRARMSDQMWQGRKEADIVGVERSFTDSMMSTFRAIHSSSSLNILKRQTLAPTWPASSTATGEVVNTVN